MIKLFLFSSWVPDFLKRVAELTWFYKIANFIAFKHFLYMFMALFMWYEACFYFFIYLQNPYSSFIPQLQCGSSRSLSWQQVRLSDLQAHHNYTYTHINLITTLQPFQGTLSLRKCLKEKDYIFFVFELHVPSSTWI